MLSAPPTPAPPAPLQPAKKSLDLLPASPTCHFRSRLQQLFLQIKAQSTHVGHRALSPRDAVAGGSSPATPKRSAPKRPRPTKSAPWISHTPGVVVAKPQVEASIFKVSFFRSMHLKLDSSFPCLNCAVQNGLFTLRQGLFSCWDRSSQGSWKQHFNHILMRLQEQQSQS